MARDREHGEALEVLDLRRRRQARRFLVRRGDADAAGDRDQRRRQRARAFAGERRVRLRRDDKIPGTYSPGRTISVARATTTIDPIASPDPGSAPAVPIKITPRRPLFGERALHPRGRRDQADTDGATDERAELRRIRGNQQRAHIFYDSLAPSSMPKLIYHDSDGLDKVLMLGSEPILIGRATECQVQTQDAMVSRRHARIFWDGNYWIEDLGSSNGVYVGNDKVQKAPFRPGDTVTCGSLVLRLMPDTSPRMTGSNMAPVAPGAADSGALADAARRIERVLPERRPPRRRRWRRPLRRRRWRRRPSLRWRRRMPPRRRSPRPSRRRRHAATCKSGPTPCCAAPSLPRTR